MAAIAIGAMLVFSASGMKAFADVIQNDIEATNNTVTIDENEATRVGYKVHATAGDTGDTTGRDAQTCNPERASVTIQLDIPTGVSASTSSLTFNTCEVYQYVDFKASTAGSYTITVKDAGAEYNEAPATVKLAVEENTPPTPTDNTGPVITPNIAGTKGDNDWYTSDVTVTWTVTDPESTITSKTGCDETTITQDTTGDTLTCKATSAGGNSEQSVTIKRDATAPTVSLVGGPEDGSSYFYGFVPSESTCEASDATSGLAGVCSVNGYSLAVGEHTITASAKDNAGNTASDTNTYTVKNWVLAGFYQPVDMGSIVNTVKGGSTVPFKFDISAATEFTSTTFNGNPIGTFTAKKVSCSAAAVEDAIEVTATGGTSFRYDSTSGQFVYNWQTPKGAGICYDTTFTAQDGSTLTAHFKTK